MCALSIIRHAPLTQMVGEVNMNKGGSCMIAPRWPTRVRGQLSIRDTDLMISHSRHSQHAIVSQGDKQVMGQMVTLSTLVVWGHEPHRSFTLLMEQDMPPCMS